MTATRRFCQWALQNQPLMGASKPAGVRMFFSQRSSRSGAQLESAYHVLVGLSALLPSGAFSDARQSVRRLARSPNQRALGASVAHRLLISGAGGRIGRFCGRPTPLRAGGRVGRFWLLPTFLGLLPLVP